MQLGPLQPPVSMVSFMQSFGIITAPIVVYSPRRMELERHVFAAEYKLSQAACGEVSRQLTLESHLASSHRAVRVLVSLRASCGSESRTRGPAVAQHKDREMLVGYFSEARRQCRLRATTARRIVGLQARSRERPVAASELPRKRADGTWRRRSHRYGTVRVRYGRWPV